MQRLEVSGAVRPIYGSLGVKRLILRVTCCDRKWQRTKEIHPQLRIISLNTKYVSIRTYETWERQRKNCCRFFFS